MTKYANIIACLEEATEGSSKLSCAALDESGLYVLEKRGRDQKAWLYHIDKGYRYDPTFYQNRHLDVSRSIDAAIDLAKSMLPGWGWLVRDDEKGAFCNITAPSLRKPTLAEDWIDGKTCFPSYATTAPLAVLLSLFRAIDAKETHA